MVYEEKLELSACEICDILQKLKNNTIYTYFKKNIYLNNLYNRVRTAVKMLIFF